MPVERPSRDLVYDPQFNADLLHWITTQPRVAARIMERVEAVRRDPFGGSGKPEPLKGVGPNTWSRRINDEHRLVYSFTATEVVIISCRYHYAP